MPPSPLPQIPPIREFLHDRLDMFAVLGPLRPEVLEALPDAFVAHLSGDAGAELRRRPTRGQRWSYRTKEEAVAVSGSVLVQLADDARPGEACHSLRERGYPDLPVGLAVAGDALYFQFPHDLFDGTAAWFHMEQILLRATGSTPPPARPVEPRPIRATLTKAGLTSKETLVAARAARRIAEQSLAIDGAHDARRAAPTSPRRDAYSQFRLDASDAALIDSTITPEESARVGRAGRATRGMKLAALALDAVDASLRDEADHGIRMNVDLRRYGPRGVRIEGPFSTDYPLGTLRSGDRSAAGLTASLAAAVSSKGPLAAMLGNMAGMIRGRLTAPARIFMSRPSSGHDDAARGYDIGVSLLPSRVPEAAWIPGEPRTDGAILLHPDGAIDPYLQIADFGDEVVFSLWDEMDVVDVDAFSHHLNEALRRRVPATAKEPAP